MDGFFGSEVILAQGASRTKFYHKNIFSVSCNGVLRPGDARLPFQKMKELDKRAEKVIEIKRNAIKSAAVAYLLQILSVTLAQRFSNLNW